jgi:diguanylate cyclase (GGDEF)-like protein/PAS domain S-box-containing protein
MATILVVDDRPSNREFLTTLLGYGGHRLLEAGNGAEALEQLRLHRVDLVITDILMPMMDGFELVQQLRRDPRFAALPVIFHTATYSAPEARALADSCGVRCVLPKPCEPEQLLAAVSQVLGLESMPRPAEHEVPGAKERSGAWNVAETLLPYLFELTLVGQEFDQVANQAGESRVSRSQLAAMSRQFSANVERMQRITARASAVLEVGMELAFERSPQRLVELFFAAACDVIESDVAGLGMLQQNESKLSHLRTRGVEPGVFGHDDCAAKGFPGRLLIGHAAIRESSPLAAATVATLPEGHPACRNLLAVPIATAVHNYGWLYFANRRGADDFGEDDERLALILAAKLAVLYENALLYDIVQRRAAELHIEAAERRRSETALRESEAALHYAQMLARLAHVVSGPHGDFERWSTSLPEIVGVEPAELPRTARGWLRLVHAADRKRVDAVFVETARTASRADIEYRLKRGDGATITVRQYIEPLRTDSGDGDPGRWFTTLQDISAQKHAESVLRESELRFRQLAENIREVFWLTDPGKKEMLYVSPAYAQIWGRDPAALIESPQAWLESIHPDDRARVAEAAVTRQTRGDYDEEYRIVRPDGTIRWIRDRAFPVRDETGGVVRIAGVAEDCTEEKQAEVALRESERRFSTLLSNVELISLMLDRSGRITYCNDYFLRLTGWTRDEAIGRDWFEHFVPAEAADARAVFEQLLRDLPAAWHYANEILTRQGGRRMIQWNNTVLRSAAGEVIGTASIGEDVTERLAAEARIRRLNRVYAVLSGINSVIVRVRRKEELFKDACEIAVHDGNFRLAWISIADPRSASPQPVAWAASRETRDSRALPGMIELDAGGRALVDEAVRTRRPAIANELSGDRRFRPAAGEDPQGIRSAAVLPLLVGDEMLGVLGLYSAAPGFFDEEELKLLEELAGDIAFALVHISKSEQLDYVAYFDEITGLANRRLFQEQLAQHLAIAADQDRKLAVIVIDVERFKVINDTLGRQAGDSLLKLFGGRLRSAADDAMLVARIGADHFALLVPDVRFEEDLVRLLDQLREHVLAEPFVLGTHSLRVAVRAGVAVFPADAADGETLLRNAESALHRAKESGERHLFYTPEMTKRISDRLSLENELRLALRREEFVLHYQPKVEVGTRRIVGVEALLRWQSPARGLVPPVRFIPMLEETGLILPVGGWVLERAVDDHRQWLASGLDAPRIAVNVSSLQLRQPDFVATVEQALRRGTGEACIDVEITESVIMEDIEQNIGKLRELSGQGVNIAIDDFGTGYSSLSYLAKLPVHALKIDRSFIVTMLDDPDTMTLVGTIISLAHSLRLIVVAEGVENEEQAKILRLVRCDEWQGYHFSKPLPVAELLPLLMPRK